MRISDWSSDVCSSDLLACADEPGRAANGDQLAAFRAVAAHFPDVPASIANSGGVFLPADFHADLARPGVALFGVDPGPNAQGLCPVVRRSEEHTSELQSLMRISYAVFCLKQKK